MASTASNEKKADGPGAMAPDSNGARNGIFTTRRCRVIAASVAGLAVLTGGTAYATIPSGNVISAATPALWAPYDDAAGRPEDGLLQQSGASRPDHRNPLVRARWST